MMEKVAAGRPRVDVGEMGLVITAGVDGTGGAAGRVEETGGCVEADGSDAAGGGGGSVLGNGGGCILACSSAKGSL